MELGLEVPLNLLFFSIKTCRVPQNTITLLVGDGMASILHAKDKVN
jgi:hypothetical protein